MNDSDQSSVQLFWSIEEIIPDVEVCSTLHKKWMFLKRVLSDYSDLLKKLFYTFRFVAYYIRDEWFSVECCSRLLWIQGIIREIEVHGTLRKMWVILTRVLFSYCDAFKKLCHTLRSIAYYIRNEWFWKEFCWIILMNQRNYLINSDSWRIT